MGPAVLCIPGISTFLLASLAWRLLYEIANKAERVSLVSYQGMAGTIKSPEPEVDCFVKAKLHV